MIVYPSSDLEKLRPLFTPLPYLNIDSVVAGLTPATVYVDEIEVPKTAVIWYQYKVILGGLVNEEMVANMHHFLDEQLRAEMQTAGLEWFMLIGIPAWQTHFPNLLPALKQKSADRLYYRLDASEMTWQTAVSQNLTLRPVDAALLADSTLQNLDWVKEELISERASIADFLDKSFGYCVLHKQEIIAWCMSEYNCGNRCELGIATAEGWQRKGLARLTATAVIAHATQQGIDDIGWSCWTANIPSVRTAEALGFTLHFEDSVRLFSWTDA